MLSIFLSWLFLTGRILSVSLDFQDDSHLFNYKSSISIQIKETPTLGTLKIIFETIDNVYRDPVPKHTMYLSNSVSMVGSFAFSLDYLAIITKTRSEYVSSVYPEGQSLKIGSYYKVSASFVPLGDLVSGENEVFSNVESMKFVSAPDEDQILLKDIWTYSNGDSWLNPWPIDEDLCESLAFGVLCDENNSVIELTLDSNGLAGVLPDNIGEMSFLKTFSIANNSFKRKLPVSIFNLESLEYLNVSSNFFVNNLNFYTKFDQRLAGLKKLESFNIANNEFSGDVNSCFEGLEGLTNLKHFNMSSNQFYGKLPEYLLGRKKVDGTAYGLKLSTVFLLGKNNYFQCPVVDYSNDGKIANDFDSRTDCQPRTEIVQQ